MTFNLDGDSAYVMSLSEADLREFNRQRDQRAEDNYFRRTGLRLGLPGTTRPKASVLSMAAPPPPNVNDQILAKHSKSVTAVPTPRSTTTNVKTPPSKTTNVPAPSNLRVNMHGVPEPPNVNDLILAARRNRTH